MDAYNAAYFYLKNKYGCHRIKETVKTIKHLRTARTKKEYKKMYSELTDDNFELVLNKITDDSDIIIEVLMKQYYLGSEPKKELLCVLQNKGILN